MLIVNINNLTTVGSVLTQIVKMLIVNINNLTTVGSVLTTLHSGHPVLPPTPLADPSPCHPLRSHELPAPATLPPLPHGTGLGDITQYYTAVQLQVEQP